MKTEQELRKIVEDLRNWQTGPGASAIGNAIDALEDSINDQDHQKLRHKKSYEAQSVKNPNEPDGSEVSKAPAPAAKPVDKKFPENNNPDTRQADPRAAKPAEGGTPSNPRLSEPEREPKHPENTPESPVHGKINTTRSMRNG